MIKSVTQYTTSDGKKFTDELKAEGHEQSLTMQSSIQGYVKAAGLGKSESTRAIKHISGYTAMMAKANAPAGQDDAAPAEAAVDQAVV